MARQDIIIYLKCLILCTIGSMVSTLTLPYMVTTKPRHTKYSPSTPAPAVPVGLASGSLVTPDAPVTPPKGVALYRVTDKKGVTCILLKTDALIEVNFKSHIGDERGDTYIPDNPTVEGNCKYEDESTMRISWTGYSLLWSFAKTPGGERWYVTSMELTVSTDLPQYHNIKTHEGHTFKLYHDTMVIPTPVGKSYNCEETVIDFLPNDEDAPPGLSGTLFLRAFQIQPFMFKGVNFGPAFDCSAVKQFRDETAPIAVGSTLAIAVLCTITGYGIFRYLKVKNVQYNTME